MLIKYSGDSVMAACAVFVLGVAMWFGGLYLSVKVVKAAWFG